MKKEISKEHEMIYLLLVAERFLKDIREELVIA